MSVRMTYLPKTLARTGEKKHITNGGLKLLRLVSHKLTENHLGSV